MNKKIIKTSEEEIKKILTELEKTEVSNPKYDILIEKYNKIIDVNNKLIKNNKDNKVDIHKIIDTSTKVVGTGLLAAGLYFEFTGGYFKSDILKSGLKAFKFIK